MTHINAPGPDKFWKRPLFKWGALLALLLVASIVALAWLAIAKTQGRQTIVETNKLRAVHTSDLTKSLTRTGLAAEDDTVDMILATKEFFHLTNRAQEGAQMGADKHVVFVANEVVHFGELPKNFAPILMVDGTRMYVPSNVEVLTDASHHRTSIISYADAPQDMLAQSHTIEMLLPATADGKRAALQWFTPIDYPDTVEQAQPITPGLILALGAGLLAAISPCLLQLTVFYLPMLAGVGMDAANAGLSQRAQRVKVMWVAFIFVLGFTIPYTLGGAMIGGMGQALAASGLLSPTGPVVIISGFAMIVMAVIVAYRARAPVVCHMPMPGAVQNSKKTPLLTTFISGFAIATGCLACFGGAVLAVLMVYTGLFGSAPIGALAMLLFSLGLAIPFMLAAYGLSWVIPIAQKLQRFAPAIGLISAAVMLFFGIIMISGNYHVVSGWLYKVLPLG
ncbi:MAG TPA: cytochrome c biogenesis protein CcdA [Thermoflexales bacterium]|nr:cytochrome c biogenesis protein CcdA [Thermoflexales bacterium]HQW36270.1 cytochrome c biogenesis protein CcdA [Thermoflexales bacterium]HQZ22102.1 cytochrome c biogenesis protein CcdA [Thermoflexales bacterium]HQZ98976.1 cytochrome c biogenesis protein CcdA [Thermoflexales bacterium]